ncbi:hypothetical protein Ddye_022114 [Dipteronia dyeriana]|uniref:Uncharacterized protein n=1 Tax=Dipteronia dyeriana TaxID=168575 RepID=A0AAD9WWY4_9ROSI|nr:hypothetical protein Ddye_022114 [Dipteronia dyeriana]
MSTPDNIESLCKALEDEKTARGLMDVEKDAILGKLKKEKGMKAIAEAKRDSLRGRLSLEWIDGYRQTMIDIGVPPPHWDNFSY